jgi:hypothetical protein
MTKYEEIAKLGGDYSKRYHDYREECEKFAVTLAWHYTQYLGAPKGMMNYLGLTDDLRANNELRELSSKPKLVRDADGIHYFGLDLFLHAGGSYSMHQRVALGLQKGTSVWTVTRGGRKFTVDASNLSGLDALFDELLSDAKAQYSLAVNAPRSEMGFLATFQDQ